MNRVQYYQRTLSEYVAARLAVGVMHGTCQRVVGAIAGWKTEDARAVNGAVDQAVSSWPTGEQVREAVTTWKEAAKRMHAGWEDIPADDRIGLLSPERFQGELETVKG